MKESERSSSSEKKDRGSRFRIPLWLSNASRYVSRGFKFRIRGHTKGKG